MNQDEFTEQLLALIESLMIENRAYANAVKMYAPPLVQASILQFVLLMQSEPNLRALVHERVSRFRDQSGGMSAEEPLRKLRDMN